MCSFSSGPAVFTSCLVLWNTVFCVLYDAVCPDLFTTPINHPHIFFKNIAANLRQKNCTDTVTCSVVFECCLYTQYNLFISQSVVIYTFSSTKMT